MATDQSQPTTAATVKASGSSTVSRVLGVTILVLLIALLVEVLFEAWVQTQLGARHTVVNEHGKRVVLIDLPEWPKTLKTGLYLALAGLGLAKVAIDKRWRSFISKADIALVVLGIVIVAAGLVAGSPLTLIGQALFVYLRGAIVFYAWRALNPSWSQVKPALWVVGSIIGVNAVVATVQTVVQYNAYEWLNWVDYTWALINRAHAFLDHPNHLGHVSALMMLGLVAWFVTRPAVPRKWWALFMLVALGMSATQSRESLIGVLCGILLIWLMRRGGTKVIVTALVVIITFTALQLTIKPENRAELVRRLAGVMAALHLPSGAEEEDSCVRGNAGCEEEDAVPQREIRMLYAQQGARLWLKSPIIGYGSGQFGGIVAYMEDPLWYQDKRFGPHGFNMYKFNGGKQVDSFWLHLVVETGTLGLVAYLAWMLLIGLPLWRARVQRVKAGVTPRGPTSADGVHPIVYWAASTLLFCLLVAGLSTSLEDPILPPLMFSILGVGWVVLQRGETAGIAPADGLDTPALPIAGDAPAETPTAADTTPTAADTTPTAADTTASASLTKPARDGAAAGGSTETNGSLAASARGAATAGADATGRGAYGPADRDS